MKTPFILAIALLLLAPVNAFTFTEKYDWGVDCWDGSGERSVLIYTAIVADEDGQTHYEWTQNLPAPRPQGENPATGFSGAHTMGMADADSSQITVKTSNVNGNFQHTFYQASGEPNPFFTYVYIRDPGSPSRVLNEFEMMAEGDNSMVVDFESSQPSVKAGDLVMVFFGNVCSDELAVGLPPAPLPPPLGSVEEPTEVPEYPLVFGGVFIVLISLLAIKLFRRGN